MSDAPTIAVVIPVGPQGHHARWLDTCLMSVGRQSRPADLIVIVDDMGDVELPDLKHAVGVTLPPIHVYRPPWRLGVAHAFNHGVAVAFDQGADLAMMLGADDTLELNAIASLERTYEKSDRADGYYWSEVLYSDGRAQALPCNCAAVTPGLWRWSGGFPVESASGAPDAALISILMIHNPKALKHVPGKPAARFIHRLHDQQETGATGGAPWVIPIRGWLTDRFEETQWGRYGRSADDSMPALRG